uniref:Aminotransferase-like plant mobile domain-containing protein n=1 Tax=Setaria italica TaxID=4555 RepID=K4AJ17_SETIT
MLGLSIRGQPVTGPCVTGGWRARVAAFLGREVDEQGTRTSGVLISWLREHFGHCPQDADAETVGHYCRAWILHLFACVLFPDGTGDTASWMWIHCLTDWHQAGSYSWGSAVLSFLYRQLCEACRRSSGSPSVGGCVYLLQLWMWSRLPVGRPEIMLRRPWFPDEPPRRQPTWAYIWDQVKVSHTRLDRAYLDYINEIDALTAHSGRTLQSSVRDIEQFRPRVRDPETRSFLERLSNRLRRAAARCGCRTATTRDVHVPSLREGGVGTSSQGPSGSKSIASEEDDDDDDDDDGGDDEQRAEEIGPSQLQEAPLTQPTQAVGGTRLRHPRSPYTPGTDALGHKGKGKTRRQ